MMAFLDLVLLAAIAGFLGYRLWLVLGTHDSDKPIHTKQADEEDVVIPGRARTKASAKQDESSEDDVQPTTLDKDRFLQGATLAFRQIVDAYAVGDLKTLNKLLEGPLLETFKDAIAKRNKSKKILEVDVDRIVSVEILDKREEKDKAYITVRFVSEQCLVTRNASGKVLEGDPDRYTEVTDIWTFSRPLKSSNPNWKLVATQVPES